jgi:DNA-binding FadR family transcriptional regulator
MAVPAGDPVTPEAVTTGHPHADLFTRIEGPRGPSRIVEQVLGLLSAGTLRPGDQLPPERELATLLGASRSTTREALRTLQARGLLDVRVGARGGAFLAAPSNDYAVQGFADLLASRGISSLQVTEARAVVEVGALPLVCARATAADVAELRALLRRDQSAVSEGRYQETYSVAFHMRLAKCAHNPVIDTMLGSMRDVLLASLKVTQWDPVTDRRNGLEEHRRIVDAVEAGDPDKAAQILRKHLHRTMDRAPDPGC